MLLNSISQKRLSHPLSLLAFKTCFLGVKTSRRRHVCFSDSLIISYKVKKKIKAKKLSVINHSRRFFLYFASGINIEKKVAKKLPCRN